MSTITVSVDGEDLGEWSDSAASGIDGSAGIYLAPLEKSTTTDKWKDSV